MHNFEIKDAITGECFKVTQFKVNNGMNQRMITVTFRTGSSKGGWIDMGYKQIDMKTKIPEDGKEHWQLKDRYELVIGKIGG